VPVYAQTDATAAVQAPLSHEQIAQA